MRTTDTSTGTSYFCESSAEARELLHRIPLVTGHENLIDLSRRMKGYDGPNDDFRENIQFKRNVGPDHARVVLTGRGQVVLLLGTLAEGQPVLDKTTGDPVLNSDGTARMYTNWDITHQVAFPTVDAAIEMAKQVVAAWQYLAEDFIPSFESEEFEDFVALMEE